MKQDCIIEYYGSFKEKIQKSKALKNEMVKKHGKNKFKLTILDNCILAEFPSQNLYF